MLRHWGILPEKENLLFIHKPARILFPGRYEK